MRDVVWQVDNPRVLLDKFGRKPVQAIVEHVRDGSTIRAFLLPSFHYVTVMMSGIRVSQPASFFVARHNYKQDVWALSSG